MIEVKWKRKRFEYGVITNGKDITYYVKVPAAEIKRMVKHFTKATDIECDDFYFATSSLENFVERFREALKKEVESAIEKSLEFLTKIGEEGLE